MVNTNAQDWLNSKYPVDGICKRDSDKENKNKKRADITELDISKGNLGKHFWGGEGDKTLFGSLKLVGFTKLRKLVVSSHQLTELDVSGCINLKELNCQSNQLDNLKVTNCPNLATINCSSNNFRELDLSTCDKLEEVDINECSDLPKDKISTSLAYDVKKGKLVKNLVKDGGPVITLARENDVRNILVIGITGNGKSTLANVLTNTTQFTERASSTSVTKNFQTSDIFQWEGKKYRIIDNIGFGDTAKLSDEDILFKIGEGIHEAKEGLNQILFVFKERFSEDQIVAFNLFKNFINETGITKFTTIVKTGFEDFQNPEICKNDCQNLLTQTKVLGEIINSCNETGIIYINNPPVPIINEEDSERIKRNNEEQKLINNEKRKVSCEKILTHLAKNCPNIYKLKEWESIYTMTENYNKRKTEIEQSNSSTKEKDLEEAKAELVQKVDKSIEGSIGISVPHLPIRFNLGFKRRDYREAYKANIEVPRKNN